MEIEEKQNPNPNPNSHEERPKSWSELPLDLLVLVFEHLGFTDFQRGKSLSSSWYSASRQYVHKQNKTPWLINFPEEDNNYCTLFIPDEKYKVYQTKDLGLEFGKSVCKAIYGSWLLMQDPQFNLYIVNIFTQERFNLPLSKSQIGPIFEREFIHMNSPLFWIDDKTKDYVVIWGLDCLCVVYSKKRDTSWKQIPEAYDCYDMVYKDHKLYFLSWSRSFKIFDFSGEFPQETLQCGVVSPRDSLTKLVVTVTGDVLMVKKLVESWASDETSFRIYNVLEKCEEVDSLGDETMFFYLGITVLANQIEGFNRNSIYLDGRNAKKKIQSRDTKDGATVQL